MNESDANQRIAELYGRLGTAVVAYARRYANEHAAADCAQEVFLRLMQYRVLERRPVGLAYLLKMARNQLRREHRRGQSAGRAGTTATRRRGEASPNLGTSSELPSSLERRLARLEPAHREAVVLTSVRGLRCDQAASVLAVSSTSLIRKRETGLRHLRQDFPQLQIRVMPRRTLRVEESAA